MPKSILVTYRQPTEEFVADLLSTFGQELKGVFAVREAEMTEMSLIALIYKMIDEMTLATLIAKKEGVDSRLMKVEGTVLENKALRFKFIPLNDKEETVLEDKRTPILIVGATEENIKREAQTKKLEIFTLPKDKPSEN